MAIITDVCYLTQTPRYGYVTIDDIEWVDDVDEKDMKKSEYMLVEMDKAAYADFADPRYNLKWEDDYGWSDDDVYRLIVIDDEDTYHKVCKRKVEAEACMRLCKALKQARTSKELSQVALSEKSGVARSNIAWIESGNLNASLNTILSLCEALDCSLVLIPR
jgi:DNA-binding XRE family transcriptional regulator